MQSFFKDIFKSDPSLMVRFILKKEKHFEEVGDETKTHQRVKDAYLTLPERIRGEISIYAKSCHPKH